MTTFKSKVKRVEEEANHVSKELTDYQKVLGWHYSDRKGKKTSAASHNFYITT